MENTTEIPEEVYKFSPIDLLYFIVPIILIGAWIFHAEASEENHECCKRKKRKNEIEITPV